MAGLLGRLLGTHLIKSGPTHCRENLEDPVPFLVHRYVSYCALLVFPLVFQAKWVPAK